MPKLALWFALAMLAATSAVAAISEGRPTLGRHPAELCVTTASAAPSCGPAQVDLRRDGSAHVRVDDIVYHLQLHSHELEVVLMHGSVQIDAFVATYVWVGGSLQFDDDERKVRYEVRFVKGEAGDPEH